MKHESERGDLMHDWCTTVIDVDRAPRMTSTFRWKEVRGEGIGLSKPSKHQAPPQKHQIGGQLRVCPEVSWPVSLLLDKKKKKKSDGWTEGRSEEGGQGRQERKERERGGVS